MKKKYEKAVCLALSVVMLSSALSLSGCSDSSGSGETVPGDSTSVAQTESDISEASAESVGYSSEGVYTTSLKTDKADFNGVTKDDVQIAYFDNSADSEGDGRKYADVIDASTDADGSLKLTFKDNDAAKNKTQLYGVLIDKLDVGAVIEVDFKEHKLSCDKEYVIATDNTVKLTFTLDDGEYAEVNKDDISLAGSFENMKVDSVSASGKNLTMQLTGDIAFLESSNAYLDGVVNISADAVKDNIQPIEVKIPVKTSEMYFDPERLEASDNKITVPLIVTGNIENISDTGALAAKDIVFEQPSSVKVESVTAVDDDEVTVVLSVDGAKDKNSAAAILESAKATVMDNELPAGFTPASFYPVFDYVDEKDGKFEITVEMYANNGEFAESLDASEVSFGEDFKDAEVKSFTRTSDTVAELIFTTDTNGQDIETIDKNGEIILAGGTLINRWGDAKAEETSCLRNYSEENYGRSLFDGQTTYDTMYFLGEFSALSDIADKVSSVVGGVESAYNAITWVLNFAGIVTVKDDNAEIIAKIDQVNSRIDRIEQQLAEQNELLKQLITRDYQKTLGDFDGILIKIEQSCNRIDTYLQEAAPSSKQPASDNEQEWTAYSQAVVSEMSKYNDFTETMKEIKDDFNKAVVALKSSSSVNPICMFDKLCTERFNFETQSIQTRLDYRYRVENVLDRALLHILLYYGYGNAGGTDKAAIKNYKKEFLEATGKLGAYPVDLPLSVYIDENMWVIDPVYKYIKKSVVTEDRYAYCYAINKSVNIDRLRAYSEEEFQNSKSRKSIMNFSFTDAQLAEFKSRMEDRTIKEELDSALFGDAATGDILAYLNIKHTPQSDLYYSGDYDMALSQKAAVVFRMDAVRDKWAKENFGSQLKELFGLAGDNDYEWFLDFTLMHWNDTDSSVIRLVRQGNPHAYSYGNGTRCVEFITK